MTLKSTSPGSDSAWISPPVLNLVAAGTTQLNAYLIPLQQDHSVFSTVAAGTGCRLPAGTITLGEEYEIGNHGANALLVYPAVGGFMGAAAVNVAYSLPAGKCGKFKYIGGGSWTTNP